MTPDINANPQRYFAEKVGRRFGINADELFSRDVGYRIAHPRQVAMYVLRQATGAKWKRLGRLFGRDHTTVMDGCKAVEKRMARDPELGAAVRRLLREAEAELIDKDNRIHDFLALASGLGQAQKERAAPGLTSTAQIKLPRGSRGSDNTSGKDPPNVHCSL